MRSINQSKLVKTEEAGNLWVKLRDSPSSTVYYWRQGTPDGFMEFFDKEKNSLGYIEWWSRRPGKRLIEIKLRTLTPSPYSLNEFLEL